MTNDSTPTEKEVWETLRSLNFEGLKALLKTAKEKQENSNGDPIFTTTDRIPIHEGEPFWYVNHKLVLFQMQITKETYSGSPARTFHRKEHADQFILENTPALSIRDVIDWVKGQNKYGEMYFTPLYELLTEKQCQTK